MKIFILIIGYISSVIWTEEVRYNGHEVLRLIPKNKAALDALTNLMGSGLEVDFWKEPSTVGKPVDLMVTPSNVEDLKNVFLSHNMEMKVLIPNVQHLIDNEKKEMADAKADCIIDVPPFDINQYHSHAEINTWLDSLAQTYPNISSVFSLGESYEKRDMKVIKIGSAKNSGSRKGVWLDAGIHAREWIAPAAAIYIINEMAMNTRETVTGIIFKLRVKKPETVNGCGVKQEEGLIVKIPGLVKSAAMELIQIEIGIFTGENAHKLQSYISFHSYSEDWMYPFAYKAKTYPKNVDKLKSLSQVAYNAIKNIDHVTYEIGSPPDILYAASGSSMDWADGVANIPDTFTLELRPGPSDPENDQHYGFALPASYIPLASKEAWAGVKTVCESLI